MKLYRFMLETDNRSRRWNFKKSVKSLLHMSNNPRKDNTNGVDTGVVTRVKPTTKKPSMYKVLLLNDDYTPMEFVVYVFRKIF